MTVIHDSIDLVFRRRAGQLTATLTRVLGIEHLDLVEDVVQDAFVQALRKWPWSGVPDDPGAWILRVAKNRAVDVLRRQGRWRELRDELERSILPEGTPGSPRAHYSTEIEDDQLRLVFACCHPSLSRDSQVALTLKTVGGFSVDEIARAFLARPATIAQRLVRARRKLREAGATLSIPTGERLAEHRGAVLESLYLTFNEGYATTTDDSLVRSDVCMEALRLAERVAAHPIVGGPQVHALAALFSFQAARLPGRVDGRGELVPLRDQDRSNWDRALLWRGVEHLRRAARGEAISSYHYQAEIASCHALADSYEATDWGRILACYDELMAIDRSPVVALNRVVALAAVEGAALALEALGPLREHPVLEAYAPRHAIEADLLERTRQPDAAILAFRRAIDLSPSGPVRRHLARRVRRIEDAMSAVAS